MTFAFLPALNFYLLLCPVRLSFDWSMSAVPLVEACSDARNLMTSAFYASLILMTWRVVRAVNGRPAIENLPQYCSSNGSVFRVGP